MGGATGATRICSWFGFSAGASSGCESISPVVLTAGAVLTAGSVIATGSVGLWGAGALICEAGMTASSSISGTTPWIASFAVTRRGFFIQSETHWARVMLEASVVFSRGAVARGFAGGSSLFSSHGQGSCAAAPLRLDASSLGMGWSSAKALTEVLAPELARATPKATATSPRRARVVVAPVVVIRVPAA